jgi:translocation and assembly module TamA
MLGHAMTRPRLRLLLCCLFAASPVTAQDGGLARVEVRGLSGDALDNVRGALAIERLDPQRRAALSASRLDYLLRRTPAEVRRALEPYGHYSPTIAIRIERDGDGAATVIIDIDPGEPVRVGDRRIRMQGEAADDSRIGAVLGSFEPLPGEVFDHRRYERSKAEVERRLAERGYFDARPQTARVEVSRAERRADIHLLWDSGPRHAFGEAVFGEHGFRPGLLDKLVRWTPGEPYDQARLIALQRSLADLDYFSAIDIRPDLDATDPDSRQVPIRIDLAPARRSIYSAGLSYGTDTGAGLNLGWERRWVNTRGHKALANLDWAQRRQLLTTQYRVPAFAWLDGWYTGALNLLNEEFDGLESQRAELVASRSGRLGLWNLTASLHAQRERFGTGGDFSDYTSLVYPALRAQASRGDDPLYPTRGWGLIAELRGGGAWVGSDLGFAQAHAQGRYVTSFGRRHRLLLRGEAGYTRVDDFDRFPPSLRFYAGGDRSVRGYGYREIGPRVDEVVVGGTRLLTGSVELERMFSARWGGALFVDAGDAFRRRDEFDARVGVGLGLRWRSPVGPVRVDVAHGIDNRDRSIRIHLSMGPDL